MTEASPYTPSLLIVEDHSETRKFLASFAHPLGLNILEATNGRQALSILKRQSIDVVVSDLVMPKMSGLMLLHSMLEQGYQVPFILVTGYSDKDSAIQALRLGAFDYLEKPIEPGDFVSILEEALRVSAEQRHLKATLAQQKHHPTGDATTELLIMKMRAIRHKGGSEHFPITNDASGHLQNMKDLFIQEAGPQLQFAETGVQALFASDGQARDLAFLLRVIQTVRIASEAVHLNDLAEFAWSLESTLAGFKSQPQRLNAAHIELMRQGVSVLREKVDALDKNNVRTLKQNLDSLAEQLQKSKVS